MIAADELGPYAPLFNFGSLGVIVAVLLLWARQTIARLERQSDEARSVLVAQLEREQARADRAEARVEAQNRELLDKLVPVLVESQRILLAYERERR